MLLRLRLSFTGITMVGSTNSIVVGSVSNARAVRNNTVGKNVAEVHRKIHRSAAWLARHTAAVPVLYFVLSINTTVRYRTVRVASRVATGDASTHQYTANVGTVHTGVNYGKVL